MMYSKYFLETKRGNLGYKGYFVYTIPQTGQHMPQPLLHQGARCSFVVKVFAHGVMGLRIDPSWPWYVLSCLWDDAYKRTLAANRKE